MTLGATTALFAGTALAEILGCSLPLLWLTQHAPGGLEPAIVSLALFLGLLTLHALAAGRVYAGDGGVYVATAIVWLWLIDGVRPTAWDLAGSGIAIRDMAVIMLAPRG